MKFLQKGIYGFFVLILTCVAVLFLVPLVPIAGNIQMKIVKSGSMEPAIHTGSIVVVVPKDEYSVGTVITFKSISADIPTTHRIVSAQERGGTTWYTTKGDANEDSDTNETPRSSVLGKVVISIPYAGFILDFARKPLGFVLLIVVPALVIVFGEVEKIWKEIRGMRPPHPPRPGKKEKEPSLKDEPPAVPHTQIRAMDIRRLIALPLRIHSPAPRAALTRTSPVAKQLWVNTTGMKFFATTVASVVFSVLLIGVGSIGSTVSYFSDTEAAIGNILRARALDFNVVADGSDYTFLGTGLADEDSALVSVVSPQNGSSDAHFAVHVEKTGGSDAFCGVIDASTVAPFSYDGPLLSLAATNTTFGAPWTTTLFLADGAPYVSGDVCEVDVVYTAWDAGSTEGAGGYTDEERVHLEFYAPVTEQQALDIPTASTTALEVVFEDPVPPENEDENENQTASDTESVTDEEIAPPEVSLESAPALEVTETPEQ